MEIGPNFKMPDLCWRRNEPAIASINNSMRVANRRALGIVPGGPDEASAHDRRPLTLRVLRCAGCVVSRKTW